MEWINRGDDTTQKQARTVSNDDSVDEHKLSLCVMKKFETLYMYVHSNVSTTANVGDGQTYQGGGSRDSEHLSK